jgi:6-pyruvoyltetrahydropterin/6-carboxytetrahydropterin synthase
MFTVKKTYGHELGLSCCFRQWRAQSHCNQIHGYALSFTLIFGAEELDENGWVIDFGSLKPIKERLQELFDHRLAIAGDDPHLSTLLRLNDVYEIADTIIFQDGVGCEKFAEVVAKEVSAWLMKETYFPRVTLLSVECREHGANAAVWTNDGAI